DRYRVSGPGQRRNRQQVARTIARLSRGHGAAIALPVPRPQPLGNDDVERLPDRLFRREPEDPFRSGVPVPDDAFGVGIDDGVGNAADDGPGEPFRVVRNHHHVTCGNPSYHSACEPSWSAMPGFVRLPLYGANVPLIVRLGRSCHWMLKAASFG